MGDRFVAEALNPNFGYFYRVRSTLASRRTKFQNLEIVDTPEFGKVMLLDGVTQVAEKNEYLYHEPMVHPALVAHPNPKSVLVIGAGDGGIVREVLKHNPDRVVLAELDGEVIEFCKEHLPSVSQGAFDHKAVEILVGDGRAYVATTEDRFDVIIMDMTDPFGPSTMLYTKEYYGEVKRCLRDEHSLFVMHAESAISRPKAYLQILRTLKEVFPVQNVFYVYIQMYAVLWSVCVSGSDDRVSAITEKEIADVLAARGLTGLEVYSPAAHHAMLVEYPFISKLRATLNEVPVVSDAHSTFIDEIDLNSGDSYSVVASKESN